MCVRLISELSFYPPERRRGEMLRNSDLANISSAFFSECLTEFRNNQQVPNDYILHTLFAIYLSISLYFRPGTTKTDDFLKGKRNFDALVKKECLFIFQTSGACFCNMLLFSVQLVLLKEAHSQTPTMPQGVRVTIEGWQGLNGALPREAGERVYNWGRKGG